MLRGKTEAETVRLNGWKVGDILAGDKGYGEETIRITAIGEILVLCCWNGHHEANTTFWCREWRKIK
jgi:hypothetical protein